MHVLFQVLKIVHQQCVSEKPRMLCKQVKVYFIKSLFSLESHQKKSYMLIRNFPQELMKHSILYFSLRSK
jgi:hypothetical protein